MFAALLILAETGAAQQYENKNDAKRDPQTVTNLISNMKNELDLLSQKLEDKGLLSEEASNRISGECNVQKRLGDVRQKLIRIDDSKEVIRVVKALYNNQESNFDMVFRFGDFVDNDETTFLIYSTLYSEMEKNKHNSVIRLKKLASDMREKFAESSCSSADVKAEAIKKVNSLVTKSKEVAAQQLQACLLQGNSSLVPDLLDSIFDFGFEPWQEVLTQVVHDVYTKVGAGKLLTYISNCKNIEQRVPGYIAVFNEMEDLKQLDENPALLKLAYYLKNEKFAIDNYSKPTDIKTKYDILKSRIPESIANVAFSPEVCIKNVALFQEYMYATVFFHNNDSDVGRYIFTWIPGGRGNSGLDQSKWSLIHLNDDTFYLKNAEFSDYLYASDIELALTHGLRAPLNSFAWKIIPHGSNVYLKNVRYSEYLFVDESLKRDNDRRFVLLDKSRKIRPEAEWKIESCK